ncbi:MAG: ATP-binding protein [Coprothermobacterota bacterium]|nr:ATP-binding protein [Coprothermobacterota bacterium]
MNENNWKTKWSKEQIRAMLREQFQTFWKRETGVVREELQQLLKAAALPHAVIISGLRRVGKSTLLAQIAHHLGENTFYYLNFEDERFLGFQADDANSLFQVLVEVFGEKTVFMIDEIQNVVGWEHFVRRFMDMGFKFYITGSNASLLSGGLGSRLTGRYLPVELLPFSFSEFLTFKGYDVPDLNRLTTVEQSLLHRRLDEYLELGGIPEPIKYPNLPLHRVLYDDILYRDIAARYRIEDLRALKELAFFLISNPGGMISFNKLKGQLKLGSVNTVKNYIAYLEATWLLFAINVFDFSIKRQQIAPKKIYAIDTGLVHTVGFAFSSNRGRLLENLVFLALRRQERDIYYLSPKKGYEVDFYLPQAGLLIQVAQNLHQEQTREREIRALTAAMSSLNLQEGLILTENGEDSLQSGNMTIHIQPIASWLLKE